MIDKITPIHLLQKYLGGLKDEIKLDVIAANPIDFDTEVALVKTFETKWLSVNRCNGKKYFKKVYLLLLNSWKTIKIILH